MDDDEIIQSTVGRMLESLGYEVRGVFDGVEAITAYNVSLEAGAPYDVVIMDLTVPGSMGGKEAVSQVRKLHAEARVIVSSGYSNDPVMAHYKDYGSRRQRREAGRPRRTFRDPPHPHAF